MDAMFYYNRLESARALYSYADELRHVQQTGIPAHLDQMMRILHEEETQSMDSGTTGPCLEYVLQHKLMETLYTLGRTDHPPGMKQVILSFFTKILSRIHHPLLPHINVHRAVQRLVKTCGEVKAAPTEKEEIEFLCTVCAKIKTDPYLSNFFIEVPGKASEKNRPSHPVSSQPNTSQTLEFSLVDALISLTESADARVSVKACEGLMLCASLPEESAAKCIVTDTKFIKHMSQKLCQLYQDLPNIIGPSDIDSVDAKWGLDVFTQREDHQSFIGKRTLISFVSWLDYCDQLISIAHPLIACALSTAIHENLLKGKLQPQLVQPCETGAIMATCYLTRCLKTVCSTPLLTEFTHFILGNSETPESPNESSHKLRKTLIERCNHISEEVCLSTLKLFDILLQKEDEHIYMNLLLCNLLGRNYLRTDSGEDCDAKMTVEGEAKDKVMEEGQVKVTAVSEVKDNVTVQGETKDIVTVEVDNKRPAGNDVVQSTESEGIKEVVNDVDTGNNVESSSGARQDFIVKDREESNSTVQGTSAVGQMTYKRPEVHKVVNRFLMMLPEEAKSSYQTADSGYDMYLRDATRQLSCVESGCKSWKWPREPVSMEEYKTVAEFYEGDFLHMLLNRLGKLLKQTYSINLVLTSVISRVALLPHPNLHEYLLDPFLPVKDNITTLSSVLQKMSGEILVYLKTEPHFTDKLVLARKQLVGVMDTIHSVRNSLIKSDPLGFDDQSQLEAIIVLEEFCKELSAITFVKHHAAVTRT